MKTFDEAFEKTQKLAPQDFAQWKLGESNEDWARIITGIAGSLMRDIGKSPTNNEALVACCSSLQSVFIAGMLTGIEMEKDS